MEIDELKKEVEYLKKRVSVLEKAESNRKAMKYLRIIWKIVLICAFAFAAWKTYDYFVNGIPNMVNEKIESLNPFKKK